MAQVSDSGGTETAAERNARMQAAFNTASTSNINQRQYTLERFGVPSVPSVTTPTVPNIEQRQYNLPQYGTRTPTQPDLSMQATIEARSGYTLDDPARLRVEQRGGYNLPQTRTQPDPLADQYMEMYGVPYNPYVGPADPWDESNDPLAIAQQRYFAEEIDPVTRQFSQFTGDEYYQGGSEQAALGVFHQQLGNLGMLTGEELGFLGITPTDQMSWILSPADVRRLTSDDTALSTYAGKLRGTYGDDWFEQLYEIDEETGWAQLITYGDTDDAAGDWGYSGGGYPGGGYTSGGYTSGYGDTYRSAQRWGLVNWRIG